MPLRFPRYPVCTARSVPRWHRPHSLSGRFARGDRTGTRRQKADRAPPVERHEYAVFGFWVYDPEPVDVRSLFRRKTVEVHRDELTFLSGQVCPRVRDITCRYRDPERSLRTPSDRPEFVVSERLGHSQHAPEPPRILGQFSAVRDIHYRRAALFREDRDRVAVVSELVLESGDRVPAGKIGARALLRYR